MGIDHLPAVSKLLAESLKLVPRERRDPAAARHTFLACEFHVFSSLQSRRGASRLIQLQTYVTVTEHNGFPAMGLHSQLENLGELIRPPLVRQSSFARFMADLRALSHASLLVICRLELCLLLFPSSVESA